MILKLEFDKRTLEQTHTRKVHTNTSNLPSRLQPVLAYWGELFKHYLYRNVVLPSKQIILFPLPSWISRYYEPRASQKKRQNNLKRPNLLCNSIVVLNKENIKTVTRQTRLTVWLLYRNSVCVYIHSTLYTNASLFPCALQICVEKPLVM